MQIYIIKEVFKKIKILVWCEVFWFFFTNCLLVESLTSDSLRKKKKASQNLTFLAQRPELFLSKLNTNSNSHFQSF